MYVQRLKTPCNPKAKPQAKLSQYEILLGDMRGLKWVQTGNTLNVASLGATPVEGGYENDGTPLYVARAYHNGAKHPGKASAKLDGKLSLHPSGGYVDRSPQVRSSLTVARRRR